MSARKLLTDQTLLILGGAGQMGLATARLAAQEGARLVLVGRGAESLAHAAKQLSGSSTRTLTADASNEASLRKIFGEVGPVDHVLVATSSGTGAPMPPDAAIPRVGLEAAQRIYSRLWAAYNTVHLAPLYVKPSGSVTILSGASARRPHAGFGIYSALHGALEALARAAAIELAPIRVNVVSPGNVGVKPARQLAHHQNSFDDLALGVIAVISNPAIIGAVLDVDGGEGLGAGPEESE